MNILPRSVRLAILLTGALVPALLHAAPPPVPEPLKPWVDWATWDNPHRDCPTPYFDANRHICFWPSRLGLQVDDAAGRFDLGVTVYSETWVPLPGGNEAWPFEVKISGTVAPVLQHNDRPSVKLAPGTYRLEGSYRWKEIPLRLPVPPEIGVLTLTLNGKVVDAPAWDAQGDLWLKRDGSSEETARDFLSVKVYAALEDGIPIWLRTEVELIVSGKSREEDIGSILPEGWKLVSVNSPLPVAVDDAGRMKVQVRAGKWKVSLDAFRLDNPKEFRFAAESKPAVKEELVAFRADPDFRMVDILGPTSVDVSQISFPEQWRDLPVYRWETATPFEIQERLRGMGSQKPGALKIARMLWLDENGREMTFRDQIAGQMQQIWRLDSAEGQQLGSVRNRGEGQLITRNPENGATGVEIRTRDIDLEATGRLERTGRMPASGWRTDTDSLAVTLNLPPGWRLFALFGADWVHGDWLTAWTLLDLFLLLIFSLAVFRIWGFVPALLAFFAFGLSYHEVGAPRYVWLALLIPLALLRVVPAGWGRRLVHVWKWITVVVFIFILAPFLAGQIQQTLYPQLENLSAYQPVLPPDFIVTAPQSASVSAPTGPGSTRRINQKLDDIVIPKIDFREVSLSEAIDFLQSRAASLDQNEPDPSARGVNIILKDPTSADTKITFSLTDIPLRSAIDYAAKAANLKIKIEPNGVSIVPLNEPTDVLITKEYKMPTNFATAALPAAAPQPEASGNVAYASRPTAVRSSTQDFLEASGVPFPPGASATYQPGSGKLVVRTTQSNLDLLDTLVENSTGYSPSDNNLAYDAKARIQTGPGVPDWTWRTVTFGWNGPVTAAQQVHPLLISLTLERILSVLRIILLLALAAILLNVHKLRGSFFRPASKAAALLTFAFSLFATASSQAQFPDKELLMTLRQRLTKPSDAYPNAADIPSVSLTLKDKRIIMDVDIHTAVRTAVPLPGRLPAWSPLSVLIDGKPEAALRRDDGYLWVVLPEGVHRVHVEGLLGDATEWEWVFRLKPHRVTIDAPGWTVSGVKPSGEPEPQVFFALKQKTTAGEASYDRQDFQTLAQIDRRLELGLVWQVHTTVTRLSPAGKAIALRIPLLPGENVLSSNAIVKDGFIEIRLGAQEPAAQWESELPVTTDIKLATRPDDSWVERWQLVASPVWNVSLSGLAPVFEPDNPELVPVWHPWPGESVDLAVSRPEALAGATVTVSKARHAVTLGRRQRTSQLDLSLRSSLGEDFLVTLPPDAEVTALSRNNQDIPVRKDGAKVIIPLSPGEQTVSLGWKTNVPLSFHAATDEVRLPVESANIETVLTVPDNRWVLWTNGPQRGPAVRFWSILICALLAAWILGRTSLSPLRTSAWMLLALGLTQVPLLAAMIVIAWLFFLSWRGRDSYLRLPVLGYNLLQVVLILLTAIALCIFVAVVAEGLLGNPEMFILGNGSTRTLLDWYQARSESLLPRPGCFSVSVWWYKILMLLWALWLAASLIRWLRWAWEQFSKGGCFRHGPPVAPPPPSPVQPPPLSQVQPPPAGPDNSP